jgi:hypothetical protein
MSQHDLDMVDGSGAVVRADFNLAFKALGSLMTGSAGSMPATFPNQLQADTSSGYVLKRNNGNTGWQYLFPIDQDVITSTGGTDDYVVAFSPALTSYQEGVLYRWQADAANVGAATLTFNSLSTKDLKKYANGEVADLRTGEILNGQICFTFFDNSANAMILLNPNFSVDAEGVAGFPTPSIRWYNYATYIVAAGSDVPAYVSMSGFPQVVNRGNGFIAAGSDGRVRVIYSSVGFDLGNPATFWGTEKSSQWYCIFAISGDSDVGFSLKAMPWLRVASKSFGGGQGVINLRNHPNTANIGYGFTTDEFMGAKLLVVTGAGLGSIRTIAANNNNNTTGGTITWSGDDITLSAGDWFIILPDTNFRFLGDVYNNPAGNLLKVFQKGGQFFHDSVLLWGPSQGSPEVQIPYDGGECGFFPPLADLAELFSTTTVDGTETESYRIFPTTGAAVYRSQGTPIYDGKFSGLRWYGNVEKFYCKGYSYPHGYL